MTDIVRCDMCGDIIDKPAVSFSINAHMREMGGTIQFPDGTTVEWDQRETRGDLFPSCAAPVLEHLNGDGSLEPRDD